MKSRKSPSWIRPQTHFGLTAVLLSGCLGFLKTCYWSAGHKQIWDSLDLDHLQTDNHPLMQTPHNTHDLISTLMFQFHLCGGQCATGEEVFCSSIYYEMNVFAAQYHISRSSSCLERSTWMKTTRALAAIIRAVLLLQGGSCGLLAQLVAVWWLRTKVDERRWRGFVLFKAIVCLR